MLAFTLILACGTAGAQNLTVSLTINDNSNTVYVPASAGGEISAGSLADQSYQSPFEYYISSYRNDYLAALIGLGKQLNFISTSKNSNSHTISVTQNITGSKTLLVFSRGAKDTVAGKIGIVKSGEFFEYPVATFGFGTASLAAINLVLNYKNIDIEGLEVLGKGIHNLLIENNGTSSGKPLVRISAG